jgi:uncharacterized membrane protein YedE/YeeE
MARDVLLFMGLALAWLVAVPFLTHWGYQQTRRRLPHAKQIWLLWGAFLGGIAVASFCFGGAVLLPPASLLRGVLRVLGTAVAIGMLVSIVGAIVYEWLDTIRRD